MAHFARLNTDGVVVRVHCVVNEVITDSKGKEQESKGVQFLQETHTTNDFFVQTSYNNKIRKQYAGVGYKYDKANDVFVRPQTYPSWALDASFDWQPPTAMPDDDKRYTWDEPNTKWIEVSE